MATPAGAHATRSDCVSAIAVLNGRIRSHGGQVEVVDFDESCQHLTIRMVGLCASCPAWPMTLYGLVRPYLEERIGVDDVEVADRRLSEAAIRRITGALGGHSR